MKAHQIRPSTAHRANVLMIPKCSRNSLTAATRFAQSDTQGQDWLTEKEALDPSLATSE